MVKRSIWSGVVFSTLLMFSGCGGDNSYDGTGLAGGGVQSSVSTAEIFKSLQTEVFAKHADGFVSSIATLKSELSKFEATQNETNLLSLQQSFLPLAKEWQSVEATYIAGDYDSSMRDLPILIDNFNQGKRDVTELLDNSLNAGSSNLYRNDMKAIPALEYLLFGHQATATDMLKLMTEHNGTRIDAIGVTLDYLALKAQKIANFYATDTKFVGDTEKGSDVLISVMATNAIKLKDWRIGEAGGLVAKYKDKPDPKRLQYYKSRNSTEIIRTVIKTHAEVMGVQSYENYGSFGKANGAKSEIEEIEAILNQALTLTNGIDPIEDAIDTLTVNPKVEALYDEIQKLNNTYQGAIVKALDITPDIISIDGD
ncbi:MAG TPA: hypothetical protein EYP02_08350 [Sulfurovum sp.]|nr:hypothetical protein [Sulfurovum sp.]